MIAMVKVKNGKCVRRLSLRSLRASRKRNVIAVAAIILTTLLFASLFTVALSINRSYETYQFRQIGGYSHGSFKDVTEEQAERIAAHKNVRAVGVRKVIGTTSEGVFAKTPAEISYMDANCTKWSYASPSVGRMPEGADEISMDTAALRILGIEPELGARITLTYTVGDKEQISFPKTDTFTLVGYWDYDDLSPVHYINISKAYADMVEAEAVSSGLSPFRADLEVMMASAVDIRGQMEQVDLDLGYTWEDRYAENAARIGVNWGYTTAQAQQHMDAETIVAIIAFLLLIVFTGYLIIYNIFQISVTGDIRFYGLLKTIGVTPRQLRRIIRGQALALCAVGIPLGLLSGWGVGALLTPVVMGQTTLGAASASVSASPLIFLASALFALVTVLLSCARPGWIAARVSPVEATKYTEALPSVKKHRMFHGAKVRRMAMANLGRNRSKTVLVILSLALCVVLLNVLYAFVGGFDMEKYLDAQTCADFIVSSPAYFRYAHNMDEYISQEMIAEISANTEQTISGCGWCIPGTNYPQVWVTEERWSEYVSVYETDETIDTLLRQAAKRGGLVAQNALIEGLDEALLDKLTVIDGDLAALTDPKAHNIALVIPTDDYGNPIDRDMYPVVGEKLDISYVNEGYFIDTRTGELCDDNTPPDCLQYVIADSKDMEYTVCAWVTVPYPMSFRYGTLGYDLVLPAERLREDSGQTVVPLLYLFDTPDATAEEAAEQYLADLTSDDLSALMYESKASIRADFESFQNLFLLLGGLLCAIIGIVGILNFFNAVMTGILSRRREFAVLQAVGMTNRQLKAMLILEGVYYALGAAALALVLSLLLEPPVEKLLVNLFWFFSPRLTFLPALAALPVFALLGVLVPLILYRAAAKQTIVERLREAES